MGLALGLVVPSEKRRSLQREGKEGRYASQTSEDLSRRTKRLVNPNANRRLYSHNLVKQRISISKKDGSFILSRLIPSPKRFVGGGNPTTVVFGTTVNLWPMVGYAIMLCYITMVVRSHQVPLQ